MKVARSNQIDTNTLGFGGSTGMRIVTRFFSRLVPKLKHTKDSKEGLQLLLRQIEDDVWQASGIKTGELSYKVIEEIRRNTKVEYNGDRVCITYRKFKKCMKIKGNNDV
jgi:hypothetical protein